MHQMEKKSVSKDQLKEQKNCNRAYDVHNKDANGHGKVVRMQLWRLFNFFKSEAHQSTPKPNQIESTDSSCFSLIVARMQLIWPPICSAIWLCREKQATKGNFDLIIIHRYLMQKHCFKSEI